MVNAGLKAVFAVVLLALHIIAAALAAQLYDNFFEPPLDEENAFTNILGVTQMSGWALLGFTGGAGLALILVLKGTQDEAILSSAGVALALGLIELGFGAKNAKLSQDGLGRNIKALEAFSILAGAASALIGAVLVLAGDQSSK